MKKIKEWYYEKIASKTVENLKKNNFDAKYFPNREKVLEYIEKILNNYNEIGFGGSITILEDLKIQNLANSKNKIILNHNNPELSPEEKLEIRKKQLTCELFICSANAITKDGKIVNIDGVGNRVAATIFGPKKVIIIAGINKITDNIHSALKRIKEIAAPMNAMRLNKKTPCTTTGECADCNSPERICRVTVIMEKKPALTDVEVIIVGENLGF